jgi:hypothetical protein
MTEAENLAELERQRVARMAELVEEQKMVAEANRAKADEELRKFGTGDQG